MKGEYGAHYAPPGDRMTTPQPPTRSLGLGEHRYGQHQEADVHKV